MPKVTDYKKHKSAKHHTTKNEIEDAEVMPDNKNSKKPKSKKAKPHHDTDGHSETASTKRRPGRDEGIEYIDTLEGKDAGTEETENYDADAEAERASNSDDYQSPSGDHDDNEKVTLEFFGSEMIRAQIPEVFKAAESIATEWKKDGDFSGIDVPNPILKTAASLGLQRAKQVEKKLEEKGVFLMAKMGAEFIKSKLKK